MRWATRSLVGTNRRIPDRTQSVCGVRLSDNGAQLFRGRPAWIADVDLVVLVAVAVEGEPPLSDELVQSRDGGSLGGVWPDVQDLCGRAFLEGDQPELPGSGDRLLGGNFAREVCNQVRGDDVGLADHHGPVPLRLVAGQKGAQILRGPKAFKG